MASLSCSILVLVFLTAGMALSNEWKTLDTTDGIEVALREEPGRDLPTMRGRAVLNGDIDDLLAMLIDPEQATEWAEGASKVAIVFQDESQAIVHTYIDIVWPVWDRELVTSSKLETVEPGKEYILSMTAVDGYVPEKEGVIRMKDATTRFHLKREGPGKVWVEYLVNVDPAGSLPRWLVRWTSESVPAKTLRNLQEHLTKYAGEKR